MKRQFGPYPSNLLMTQNIALGSSLRLGRFLTWIYDLCVHLLAALVWLFAKKERQWYFANAHHILGLPPHCNFASLFGRQVVRHQMSTLIDTVLISVFRRKPHILGEKEFADALQQASQMRATLITTAHLGSWELVGMLATKYYAKPGKWYALAKPSHHPLGTKILEKIRGGLGIQVLWTGRPDLLREMTKALKRGDGLGFVMDQKPQGRQGETVNFFGRPIEVVRGPAAMAHKFQANIIEAYCLRIAPLTYRISYRLWSWDTLAQQNDRQTTASLVDGIEQQIRQTPEQWTWNYKRWKF